MARYLMYDSKEKGFSFVECNNISDFNQHIGSRCFDIATRKINGKVYDIYCDDEGLMKENPVVSAVDSEGKAALVGNLIFTKNDGKGNTIELNEEEMEHIVRCFTVVLSSSGKICFVIHPVDYVD